MCSNPGQDCQHFTYASEKYVFNYSPSSERQIVGQTVIFKFDMASILRKKKPW